jgi:hypothetical protein
VDISLTCRESSDSRRVEERDPEDVEGRSETPSPGRLVVARGRFEEFRRRPTEEERLLGDLRAQGYERAEIAT